MVLNLTLKTVIIHNTSAVKMLIGYVIHDYTIGVLNIILMSTDRCNAPVLAGGIDMENGP